MGAGPKTRRVRGAVGAAFVVLAMLVGSVAPADARIASLSKSSDTVAPGESTTVTVTVQHEGQTCISVDSLDGASVDMRGGEGACDDEPSWSRTYVVSAASVGDHRVRFGDDRAGDSQIFTLRVREAAPPPPPPPTTTTTTTTARPPTTTTTARPTTTTAAPTTEAPATTTTTAVAETTTTTTVAPPPPGGGFVPVASLVAEGVPELGVFLPLTPSGYRTCLPLSEPCVDPTSAIVLVPARTTELVWPTIGEDERSSPRVDLRGVPALLPVGRAPDDPAAQDYALPVVDLAAEGGQLRTLVRGLDDQGRLVTPRVGSGVAAPVAEGPMAAPETTTFLASSPFGRPRLATKDQFTEAAPAVVLFSATELQPVYAIRADPRWGLDVEVLPLYTSAGVPYLVRGVDGPPGLYLSRPEGLRIPQTGSRTATSTDDPVAEGEGVPAVALLGGAVGVATIATVALGWRRRRSLADPQ